MTVAVAPRKIVYLGSGSAGPFSFNFRILISSNGAPQIAVTKISSAGVRTTLVYTTNYTFTAVNGGINGGSITLLVALAVGETLLIEGDTATDQLTRYSNQGRFLGTAHEQSFDKLTMVVQEALDSIDRSLKFPGEDSSLISAQIPPAATRALQFLGFDASGAPIVGGVSGATVSAAMQPVVAAATLGAALTAFGFSAFAQTLIDDANATAARTTLGAAGSGANSDITSLSALASINNGQIAGFRNGVINGAFDVWQRGTSFTPSAGVATYTADRWVLNRASANYTVSRQTGPDGSLYCARVQRDSGNAATDPIYTAQALISADSYRYRGKKCTLRFKARAGANYSAASGNLAVEVYTGTGTDQSPFGFSGAVQAAFGNVVLTTSWQTFSITSSAAIGASITQIQALFTFTPVGTAGAADYFEISEVELVEGEVGSTYFERLNFSTVLQRCLPFYQKSFLYATAPAQNAGANTGEFQYAAPLAGALSEQGYCHFQTPMRAAPSSGITFYNPAAANAQVRDIVASADCSASAVANISEKGFRILCTGNAGTAVGNVLAVHWQATAEL